MPKAANSISISKPRRLVRQSTLWMVFKWSIFLLSAYYIYYYLIEDAQLSQVLSLSASRLVQPYGILLLLIPIALIPVNWGFEAYKWKLLLRKFQRVSFPLAFQAVLTGTSVSLWVPNRTGEYLGRILFIQPGKRIKGALATLIGSVAQVLTTISLGIIGLVCYTYGSFEYPLVWAALVLVGGLCLALLLVFYFNINQARHLIPKYKWARLIRKYALVYRYYNMHDLRDVLFLSIFRYMTFSLQFYLLLKFYGLHMSIPNAFISISLMYLVQTAIPTNTFTELGIRGLCSSVFLHYTSIIAPVVAATYTLWLINLMVPGMIGLVFLLFARYKQKAVARS